MNEPNTDAPITVSDDHESLPDDLLEALDRAPLAFFAVSRESKRKHFQDVLDCLADCRDALKKTPGEHPAAKVRRQTLRTIITRNEHYLETRLHSVWPFSIN